MTTARNGRVYDEVMYDRNARREAALLPPALRQARVDDLLIKYPIYEKVVSEVQRVHMPVVDGTHGRGTIEGLLGASRAGKSKAITHYVDGLGLVPGVNAKIPRAVYIDAKSGMTSTQLANELRAALILGSRVKMNAGQTIGKAIDEMEYRKVELVVIDDVQFLLRSASRKTVEETFGFIIEVAERRICNVLLAGTPEVHHDMKRSLHAFNRGGFGRGFIHPYDWRTPDGRKGFRALLSKIDSNLPFHEMAGLADPMVSAHLYKLSEGGYIGKVMNIVRPAAYAAINARSERIELDHLVYEANRRRAPNESYQPFASPIDPEDPVGDDEAEDARLFAEVEEAEKVTLTKKRSGRPKRKVEAEVD